MTQLTLLITVVLSVMTLVFPRKYMLLPYVIGACWVPADQTIMVGELNFQVLRILVSWGMLRLWIRGEMIPDPMEQVRQAGPGMGSRRELGLCPSMDEHGGFHQSMRPMVEWLGLYWVFRQSLRSWEDMRLAYVAFAVCAIAMVPFIAWSGPTGPIHSALWGA